MEQISFLRQDSFVTLLGRRKKFEASILRQTKREQSDFLLKEVSNAEKFRQLILTGGTELKQFRGLPYSKPAWCYSYGQKAAKWELQYWRNLPIGHSHFRTKIMLKITEHTSPTDTGINIHYNDWNFAYYRRKKNSRMNSKNANNSYGITNLSPNSLNFQVVTYHPIQASVF